MGDYGDGSVYARGKRWWISYHHKGQRYREPGGRTQPEAKRKLKARLREIYGDKFIGPVEERITVGELLDDLITHLQTRGARSIPSVRSHLKLVREFFGATKAADVTTAKVEEYIRTRQEDGAANATVNRQTGALRQAFNLASKRKPPKLSRAPHIPTLHEDNARQGFVEPAVFEAIAANLPEPVNEIARYAYLTGWRKSHVLGLAWDQVNRSTREVRPGNVAKNKRATSLPLTGPLWDLIERRWEARTYEVERDGGKVTALSAYVFHVQGQPVVDFKRSWQTACRKAGVPGILFHDLRRSAVRNLIRAGVPQSVAMRISGHKTSSMFNRYDVTSQDDKRAALDQMHEHIAGKAGKKGEGGA